MVNQKFTEEELKKSTRIFKSATPKYTLDWYIKWISSIIVLIAISFRATGLPEFQIYDMILSWIGGVGWFIVAFLWKDRALLILNAVLCIVLFSGILKYFLGNG